MRLVRPHYRIRNKRNNTSELATIVLDKMGISINSAALKTQSVGPSEIFIDPETDQIIVVTQRGAESELEVNEWQTYVCKFNYDPRNAGFVKIGNL